MQEEFYAITFRKKLYDNLELLQQDLDHWLTHYNEERPHNGRYCYGKAPSRSLMNLLPLPHKKLLNQLSSAA
jgi:hypothetical protein